MTSTNDLRTRIAAAIMQSCHGVFTDDAVDAADAVIRELNDMGIIHLSRVVGCQTGPVGHEGECR